MFRITVIIATSSGRTDLLFYRALDSVYNQTFYDNVDVIISDDTNDDIDDILKDKLNKKRINMSDKMPTRIIKNFRTKNHSGTGAWNSAALSCINFNNLDEIDSHFLAFLDYDDSWDKSYLSKLAYIINSHEEPNKIGLISCSINFISSEGNIEILEPSMDTLTEENIFIRNPYIQGSNLFINLKVFLSIGGFDESLKSTTDRDLMMRYVEFIKLNKDIKTLFIKEPLMNYFYDDNLNRVTNNKEGKHQGLDLFYRKYDYLFDDIIKEKSIERANKLFSYEPSKYNAYNKKFVDKKEIIDIKFNLILGFICFDENNIKDLLESFFTLNFDYINNLDICIISTIEYSPKFDFIISHYKDKCTINIKYLNDKECISNNKIHLQKLIYDYGNKKYNDNFVTWIVDDNSRFYVLNNNQKYYIDYFYYIARNINSNIDCIIGGNCGDIELPFFSALRTQLLDLSYHIKVENTVINSDYLDIIDKEYYNDLSSKDFNFLEYPVLNFSVNISEHIEYIKKLCIFTRKIYADINTIGNSEYIYDNSIYIGENTIIYNSKLLKINNFIKSNFNWSIINPILMNRNIIKMNLPITHIKYNHNLYNELENIDDYLISMIFYRLFHFIGIQIKYDNIAPSFDECCEYINDELYKLKSKLFFNIMRINTLNQIIIESLKDTDYYNQYKIISNNVDKILSSFNSFVYFNKLNFNENIYLEILNLIYKY
ncbi:hypothetical protein [Brachyspira sp.]|uniref:glycosyltransferase n=1 Tax=Brachyspira sp. TaxID=1977261 RepID=UPI00262B0A20|nr:hypothetical protein [Brachyspira sp.]